MKWYNGIMFVLTVACVGIVVLALTGCANTQMVEDAKRETEYRNEFSEYGKSQKPVKPGKVVRVAVEVCEPYDEGITLKDFLPDDGWKDVVLEEHERPKYTVLELKNGKTVYLYPGEQPKEKSEPGMGGFTYNPTPDKDDDIGGVQRGDATPYLSNLASTGNVEGEVKAKPFEQWYAEEEERLKKHKYRMQKLRLNYKCHTEMQEQVITEPIKMPKEWMDQWPSLRDQDIDKNSEK